MLSTDHPETEALWHGVAGRTSLAVTSARGGEGTSLIARALWQRAGDAGRGALLLGTRGAGHARPERLGNSPLARWTPEDATLQAWREPGAMRAALTELRADWDFVVVDAPALLERGHGTLPGVVAAAATEAALLVVLAGRTAASTLREARAALDAAGVRLAGVAMNDRDNPRLAAEMARQAGRLARFAPRWRGRIERALGGSSLLGLRV